jgi:hypothetical protein
MLTPALRRTQRIVRRLRSRISAERTLMQIGLAQLAGADPRDVQRARRSLPRYTGTVARPILLRAAVAAGSVADPRRVPVAVAGLAGRGTDVEAVVRYRLPDGGSMIRKTLLGERPREVLAYLSGAFAEGVTWRIPRLLHAEPELVPAGPRWHLFLEDLGRIERLEAPDQIVAAAWSLGELSGSRLDDSTLASLPWLTDRVEPYRRLDELREAGRAVHGTVAPRIAARVDLVLGGLSARRIELRDRFLRLPRTLCHGDPTRANLTRLDGRTIMFDLGSCAHGPIGSDLGGLLALPNPAVRHRRLSLEDCLSAYRSGIAATAGTVDPDLIGFGFRYRLLIKSFAWSLVRLPPPLGASAPDPRRVEIKRRSVEADLDWLCSQAMILLDT